MDRGWLPRLSGGGDAVRTYSTHEVAEFFKVSPDKILAFIRSGEIEAVNVATRGSRKARFRITNDQLQAFLRLRATRSAPKPTRRRRLEKDNIPEYV